MSSGSIGSHRAFMGVCITVALCLVLVLYVGWNWYFESLRNRQVLQELAEKAERKVRELEKLGLTMDATVTPADSGTAPAVQVDKPAKTVTTTVQRDDTPPISQIKSLNLQDSDQDLVEALALLERYWKTTTWSERVPMVYNSSQMEPLMKDYYERQKGADPVPGGLVNKARYQINGTEILYFSYTSNRPTGSLEVAMLRGPDGKFLLDWESLVGYGEMSFEEFREKRPTESVTLRAYVRTFEYYNFEFNDSKKYLCVKVTAENGENTVYAYCDRSTPLGRWLESDLASTGPTNLKGYTLKLSFPPDAQSNQCVLINKVITPRWLNLP